MNAKKYAAEIREMIADGYDDQHIADWLTDTIAQEQDDDEDARLDAERECRDFRDDLSPGEQAMCDRLDMGRNEAGEWLGFM